MFSKVPADIARMSKEDINKEMLRAALIAELDAINLYEQMAGMTENDEVRRVLLDVAKEEKTHIGEFQTLLLRMDKEQVEELEAGREEVDEELQK
ncbi:ferritin family protein [Methanolobus mangrovi]|uniref:Ferritin family protein n=1 Tax=Methanolobus mangrovi TaxID=3072977 RepID=A0AA51UGU2_9EURY|nr:ferritin family protein [Methanolobus mangrovi]WMW21446.1 ferritin family protein [Methanolobus mangrovi]